MEPDELVTLGRVTGLFGVRGWVRVFSYTDPRENIVTYSPWQLWLQGRWERHEVAEGQRHGKGVLARLAGIDDRDRAAALVGAEIAVRRDQLPAAGDAVYWADLQGLAVRTTAGADLGVVDHLLETGANDVLVVRGERERLIPYDPGGAVRDIDWDRRVITVDWDPDF